jgi:hypothetical protein
MEKKLLRSEKDLIEFFLKELGDLIMEEVLKIEFPFEDGSYHSEPPDNIEDEEYDAWEVQPTRTDKFRTTEYSMVPEQYPCVVVFSYLEYSNHNIHYMIEYVYPKDFE